MGEKDASASLQKGYSVGTESTEMHSIQLVHIHSRTKLPATEGKAPNDHVYYHLSWEDMSDPGVSVLAVAKQQRLCSICFFCPGLFLTYTPLVEKKYLP